MPEMVSTMASGALGWTLREVSLKTHDGAMDKIDAWAERFEDWSFVGP